MPQVSTYQDPCTRPVLGDLHICLEMGDGFCSCLFIVKKRKKKKKAQKKSDPGQALQNWGWNLPQPGLQSLCLSNLPSGLASHLVAWSGLSVPLVPRGGVTMPCSWGLTSRTELCLQPEAAEGGKRGVASLEPSVCGLVTPTPGPQQNSKLVRSCLAVSGDV